MSDILTTGPELTGEQISKLTRETNYGTWRFQKTWKPLYIADAEGCWFTDGAGKRYLDFSSQLMCVNLGHKNPRVVESIAEQARELAFVGPVYATAARARLSAKLLEVAARRASTNSSSPPAEPKPTRPRSKSPAWTPAKPRSSRAIALITVPRWARSPPPAIRAAGRWSRQAKAPASSSRLKPTATTAPSSTPTPAATSPAPTTSST